MAWHPQSVALAEGAHQLAVEIVGMALQPLLELVQNQQNLGAPMPGPALSQGGGGHVELARGGQVGEFAVQGGADAGLGSIRRGRHVDRANLAREPRNHAGLHQG